MRTRPPRSRGIRGRGRRDVLQRHREEVDRGIPLPPGQRTSDAAPLHGVRLRDEVVTRGICCHEQALVHPRQVRNCFLTWAAGLNSYLRRASFSHEFSVTPSAKTQLNLTTVLIDFLQTGSLVAELADESTGRFLDTAGKLTEALTAAGESEVHGPES